MPTVLPVRGRQHNLAPAKSKGRECVVSEFPVGKQAGIGGDDRTTKLKRQSAVREIEAYERLAVRFTRRVRPAINFQISLTC